ncbi:uncharacterized protein CIMG_12782 [Coccidioides immitis RS]|uniref:Uncharacterized protein n=1 Tax=Coccidioides immitis (strain RS) TaxID=246410 RepID=J3KJB3_COCIM|nr:uncharacterized protein CIMG_12782 [Coccidioides immitis RS]EAS36133.3 hypothetical protein CIMG_12782 [Coccidioides immitis RS]
MRSKSEKLYLNHQDDFSSLCGQDMDNTCVLLPTGSRGEGFARLGSIKQADQRLGQITKLGGGRNARTDCLRQGPAAPDVLAEPNSHRAVTDGSWRSQCCILRTRQGPAGVLSSELVNLNNYRCEALGNPRTRHMLRAVSSSTHGRGNSGNAGPLPSKPVTRGIDGAIFGLYQVCLSGLFVCLADGFVTG